MKIKTFCMGVCATNCYVVCDDDKNCIIIDPCDLGDKIYSYIKDEGLTLSAVLITHAHFDHIYGLTELMQSAQADGLCNVHVYVNKDDISAMTDVGKNLSATLFFCPYTFSGELTPVSDGQKITAGSLVFDVMSTSGHTVGSTCFVCEKERVIFSGDTLFKYSCGRCDFDGGNTNDMLRSLKRLSEMSGNYTVYPGHGESTTLDDEREGNPNMP